jgi:hypothetical protein
MNSEAKNEFLKMNSDLNGIRQDLIGIESQRRKLERAQMMLTNQFTADIANQIDPDTQKPKYSNSDKRDAELIVRQTNSGDWMEYAESIEKLDDSMARARVDATSLANEIAYCLNHVSDEFEGELRAFRSEVSEEIQASATQAAKSFVAKMLSGLSFQILTDKDPEPPEFVKQGIPVVGEVQKSESAFELSTPPEDIFGK